MSEAKPEPEVLKTDVEPNTQPALSTADFRTYNRMADTMNYFHNSFRNSWTILYDACKTSKRPGHMTMKQFLNIGLELCSHLELHHRIEEQQIFPLLARKMSAFQQRDVLIGQHRRIHEGLERLLQYLDACRVGERELRLQELKEVMDGFGTVLWQHLDDEVEQLAAENMRKFWSLEEMRRMPM